MPWRVPCSPTALLQLAADYLSETNPLTTFWRDRPASATGQRHYQTAG